MFLLRSLVLLLAPATAYALTVDPPQPKFKSVVQQLVRKHVNDPRKLQIALSKALPGQKVMIDAQRGLRVTLRPVSIYRADVRVRGGPHDLQKKIKQVLGTIQPLGRPCVDRRGIDNLKRDVLSTLKDMGYDSASVRYTVQYSRDGGVLEFVVNAGEQACISRLRLNSDVTSAEVRRSVSQIIYGPWWWLPWKWRLDKYRLERARQEVVRYLRDLGYFDALVSYSVLEDNSVVYNVSVGSQYRLGGIEWCGPWSPAQRSVAVKPGVAFTRALYGQLCSRIDRKIAGSGASFIPKLWLNQRSKTVLVRCELQQACTTQVQTIALSKNTKTYHPLPAYRLLGLYPGDLLTPEGMQALRRRCMLQFQDVKVLALGEELVLEVEEQDQGYDAIKVSASASYNVIEGLDAELALSYTDPNFAGQGRPVLFKIAASDVAKYVMLQSQERYLWGTETSGSWSVYVRDTNKQRVLGNLFSRSEIHYSVATFQTGAHIGFVRPVSPTATAELYFQSRFDSYGLSPMGVRYAAAQEALGLIQSSELRSELRELPYMIAQCGGDHSPLRAGVESIINGLQGGGDVHAAAMQFRMILEQGGVRSVFNPEVFPTCFQSVYSMGLQWVDHELDRLTNPTHGYRSTYDLSLHTSLDTVFAKAMLLLEYYRQVWGYDTMCKFRAGQVLGATYWINNFTIAEFPCRLINHSPTADDMYAVGGRSGAALTLSTKVFATTLWCFSLFVDVAGLWSSGLGSAYTVNDEFGINCAPGIALTMTVPGLPPIEMCLGVPITSGQAVPSSFFNFGNKLYFTMTMSM